MSGYCCQKTRQQDAALEEYRKAFAAALELPVEVSKNSTFPFIGEEICRLSKNAQEKLNTRQTMNRIMGENEVPTDKVPQQL